MAEPVDPESDFSAVTGDRESVTVTRHDPDAGDILATSTPVHANRFLSGLFAVGDVYAERVTWHLRADQVSFTPRERDRITQADGVVWVIGPVVTLPKDTGVYVCSDCTRLEG